MAKPLPATLRVEELPSGQTYGYVLPSVERLLLSGAFPAPVAAIAREVLSGTLDAGETSTRTDEEIGHWDEFRSRVVASMVRTRGGTVTIDVTEGSITPVVQDTGTPCELGWEEVSDPDIFPADDRNELFLRAIRARKAPKAVRAT